MFTKKSSREWLGVAASLVVFLSGTMLPDVDTQLMETASDEWLADFDGDGGDGSGTLARSHCRRGFSNHRQTSRLRDRPQKSEYLVGV